MFAAKIEISIMSQFLTAYCISFEVAVHFRYFFALYLQQECVIPVNFFSKSLYYELILTRLLLDSDLFLFRFISHVFLLNNQFCNFFKPKGLKKNSLKSSYAQ